MRSYRVGQSCSHHSFHPCRWSSFTFSIFLMRHYSQFWTCSTESEEVTSSSAAQRNVDPEASQHVLHAKACCECSA